MVVAPIVSAVAGLLFARRVLTQQVAEGWALPLARAAVVIGEIGIVLGVVAAIGNLFFQR